jgi:hypothetical protein
MNNVINSINTSGWADWYLDKFEIDFESVLITITEPVGVGGLTICCKDYIGFSIVGHWDESVIEDINVTAYGSLVNESLYVIRSLYGENPLPGGGVKKVNDNWYQVDIKLIDGNIIKVASKSLNINGL